MGEKDDERDGQCTAGILLQSSWPLTKKKYERAWDDDVVIVYPFPGVRRPKVKDAMTNLVFSFTRHTV